MAFVKEIDTKRPYQVAAYRQARRALSRQSGIVLADGVGLGKTYEALATASTFLAQMQHGKERKQQEAFRVLIVVPPNLVTKWASELEQDRFLFYLRGWGDQPTTRAVYRTFSDEVVVLRRYSDLKSTSGKRRYRKDVLPPGCYVTNSNLLFRTERKATQIHNTPWDIVIVDEAHRIAGKLAELEPHTLIASTKTKTILLTATPFQLSPAEMEGLLTDTFGGYGVGDKWELACKSARAFYQEPEFREYLSCLNHYFRYQDTESLQTAARLQKAVSNRLRERIIRNKKKDRRRYYFVDSQGIASPIRSNLFELGDHQLTQALASNSLIVLGERDIVIYLKVRNQLASACASGRKPFVAAALRQLMSTYEQFHNSAFGKGFAGLPHHGLHPKLNCLKPLVERIIDRQRSRGGARHRGWFEKILIFTTYVGGEHSHDFLPGENRHGTASTLKRILEAQIKETLGMFPGKIKRKLRESLIAALRQAREKLNDAEYKALDLQLRRFAGSSCACFLLSSKINLKREKKHLRRQLQLIGIESDSILEEEEQRRARERRERRLETLMHRYTTRNLVARYDGTLDQTSRDRHLRGFNSPFAPLVLIASAVGQEGIDLQRYCSHVIHYDLEWNPAKLEQREGRVDRQGREAAGPVNVYFLICRDTYDERVLHVMVNRMRWHQVLLPNRKAPQTDINAAQEPCLDQKWFKRIALDLRPRK